MPALHPLLARLRHADLGALSATAARELWQAAAEGGVTPAEAAALKDVYDAAQSGWSQAARDAWTQASDTTSREIDRPTGRASAAAEAEDLTAAMRTVWMQGFSQEADQAYAADMALLAHAHGFKLVIEHSPFVSAATIAYELAARTGLSNRELADAVDVVESDWDISPWGEDNKIVTGGTAAGAGVVVRVSEYLTATAISDAEAFTWTDGYHAFEYGFQGAVAERGENTMAKETALRLGQEVEVVESYLEGGNVLPGTTSDGKAYALVGVDSVVITAFHLRDSGALSAREIADKRTELETSGALAAANVAEIAEKLGRVYDNGGHYRPAAVTLAEEARDFAAVLELAKDQIAFDLGLPRERAVFVTQPEFHIDMHLRPAQAGEVMVHHPLAAIEALDEALGESGLPSWERTELHQMRAHAVQELAQRGGVYDRILSEIEEAGLIAVPAPGVFESSQRFANFMNAVPFTSADGVQVFATNASSLKSLERAFERFAKQLGVDEVTFLAGAGGARTRLSGSEQSLEDAGALDCREVDHAGHMPVHDDPLDRALGL